MNFWQKFGQKITFLSSWDSISANYLLLLDNNNSANRKQKNHITFIPLDILLCIISLSRNLVQHYLRTNFDQNFCSYEFLMKNKKQIFLVFTDNQM